MTAGRYLAVGGLVAGLALATFAVFALPATSGSCASFAMKAGETTMVGHNLDEGVPVPGLVVVNPRGLAKTSWTYEEVLAGRLSSSTPRVRWTSRYGSLTYNVSGHEFPDGGFNEAGLYVGEQTLMATEWPSGGKAARIYHHQWMQYLLDNFATVDEALRSLETLLPAGHCKWQFLLADKTGDVAVVEFLKEGRCIFRGSTLPYPLVANGPYDVEVKELATLYAGFGGSKDPQPRYPREDPRFRWMAVMLAAGPGEASPVDYAFSVLSRIDLGTTKWSVVTDLAQGRMFFRTSTAANRRWVDLAAFDLACTATPLALDIQRELEGDVSSAFTPLTAARNDEAVAKWYAGLDVGFFGNVFWKPRMVKGLGRVPGTFTCAAGPDAGK